MITDRVKGVLIQGWTELKWTQKSGIIHYIHEHNGTAGLEVLEEILLM